jgi:hypothetical protein
MDLDENLGRHNNMGKLISICSVQTLHNLEMISYLSHHWYSIVHLFAEDLVQLKFGLDISSMGTPGW